MSHTILHKWNEAEYCFVFTVFQIVSLYPFSEFINRHSLPQIRKLAQMINPDDNTLEKELNLKNT